MINTSYKKKQIYDKVYKTHSYKTKCPTPNVRETSLDKMEDLRFVCEV